MRAARCEETGVATRPTIHSLARPPLGLGGAKLGLASFLFPQSLTAWRMLDPHQAIGEANQSIHTPTPQS